MELVKYKIIGMDENRPPLMQSRPCIDLFFELNEAAPKAWCDQFSSCVGNQPFAISIDPEIGLHIETWVRTPDQIARSLETVKSIVSRANDRYAQKLKADSQIVDTSDETIEISPAQQALNDLVGALNFDD